MRAPVATALAIALGLIVLLGYFIPAGTANKAFIDLMSFRTLFVDGAVTLAGFATLVAILGLVGAHWRKLRARRSPDRYSLFMLIAFIITVAFGGWSYALYYLYGNTTYIASFQQVVSAVQAPVEASLMAILAVTLTLASLRLFQRRRGLLPVVFMISVALFLLLNTGILAGFNVPLFGDVLGVLQFLPVAGGRGILMGIALGSLMAGLRILLGADRPYSG